MKRSAIALWIFSGLFMLCGYYAWTVSREGKLSWIADSGRENPSQSNSVRQSGSGALAAGGQTRAAASYQANAGKVTIYSGQFVIGQKNPNWWLYGRSTEEVGWLEMYGYPTPAEELLLSNLSDEEIERRASAGDLKARVHSAARKLAASSQKNDLKALRMALGELGDLTEQGGPYFATKAMLAIGEVMSSHLRKAGAGAKTEDQKKLQRSLIGEYDSAFAVGAAYGDHTLGVINSYAWPYEGNADMTARISPQQFGEMMAVMSRRRIERGLGPLTLYPRPLPPNADQGGSGDYFTSKTVYERQ